MAKTMRTPKQHLQQGFASTTATKLQKRFFPPNRLWNTALEMIAYSATRATVKYGTDVGQSVLLQFFNSIRIQFKDVQQG